MDHKLTSFELNKNDAVNEFFRATSKVMTGLKDGAITDLSDLQMLQQMCQSLTNMIDYQQHPEHALTDIAQR